MNILTLCLFACHIDYCILHVLTTSRVHDYHLKNDNEMQAAVK